jgi:acetyl-CoA acyltransferase
MGESAEKMAKEQGVRREEQDAYAHLSHQKAARAWAEGRFDDQVMVVHVPPSYERSVVRDETVRFDSNLDAYANLSPVFDQADGTITAGNSSPLSDGASAAILVRETKARELGLRPLGFVRSHAFAAVDPRGQLLIGPVDAIPVALGQARLSFEDVDLVDMHEAFAAQVLSVTREMEWRQLGRVDWDRFNVDGGSIAIGHPFAATGTRQITQTLRAMQRESAQIGLCSACAAGGLAAAVVLEAA